MQPPFCPRLAGTKTGAWPRAWPPWVLLHVLPAPGVDAQMISDWRVLISWNVFPNKVNSSFKEFLKLEERFVVSTKDTYQMWWLNMAYFSGLLVPWFSPGKSCITSCPLTRSWNICIDVHIYIYDIYTQKIRNWNYVKRNGLQFWFFRWFALLRWLCWCSGHWAGVEVEMLSLRCKCSKSIRITYGFWSISSPLILRKHNFLHESGYYCFAACCHQNRVWAFRSTYSDTCESKVGTLVPAISYAFKVPFILQTFESLCKEATAVPQSTTPLKLASWGGKCLAEGG